MLLKIGENIERPQVFSLNISFLIKISPLCLYLSKFTWILTMKNQLLINIKMLFNFILLSLYSSSVGPFCFMVELHRLS